MFASNNNSLPAGQRRSFMRWSIKVVGVVCGAVMLVSNGWAFEKLPSYNIDINQTSLSGVSAGGYMANQFHVAYSKNIVGAGILAGGPYNCSQGSLGQATTQAGSTDGRCMENPQLLTNAFIQQLYKDAQALEAKGQIDPMVNMKNDKVFIVHGSLDITVKPAVGDKLKPWYILAGVPADNIKELKGKWGHAHITDDWGNPCNFDTEPPWVSNCGIDASGQILEYIYGPLNPKVAKTALKGRFIEFDQAEFLDPAPNSMQPKGVAYVPKACDQGEQCRLHVYFHGCEQTYDSVPVDRSGDNASYDGKGVWKTPYPKIGDTMWKNAGLNEWAESNNMIILYPQAKKSYAPYNPKGCWDWWGYINSGGKYDYATKLGPQMKGIYGMVSRLTSGFNGSGGDGSSDGSADGSSDGSADGSSDGSHDGSGDGVCPAVKGTVVQIVASNPALIDDGYFKYTTGDHSQVWAYTNDVYTVYIGNDGLGYIKDPKNCVVEKESSMVTTYAGIGGAVSPESKVVEENQVTSFTVTAAKSYQIASVTGCDGSLNGNTYTTGVIRQNCQITALFIPAEQNYTVTATAEAGGAISPMTQQVAAGQSAKVTVTPNANYEIKMVSGCGGSLVGQTFTTGAIAGNCQISATFNLIADTKYTVTAIAAANGKVSPASQQVVSGKSAVVTVTPDGGYSIDEVVGCGGSRSGNAYTTGLVTANCEILATFVKNVEEKYTVNAIAGQGGSVTPTTQQVGSSQKATIAVTALSGYQIDKVTGCSGALSGNTYTTGYVTANCEVMATFTEIQETKYTVNAVAGQGGKVTPTTQQIVAGQKATITVTASAGYKIDKVTGCSGNLSGNTYTTGPVAANCEVLAVFVSNDVPQFTVTATAGVGGKVSPTPQEVVSGQTATIEVTANNGYQIEKVTGCGGNLNGSSYTTGKITANCEVVAAFKETIVEYTVTASAGKGGDISPATKKVISGKSVTLTVTPRAGYSVAKVTGCSGELGADNTYVISSVTANCSVLASFVQDSVTTHTVEASAGTGGAVSPATQKVVDGQEATITVTADESYTIKTVTGCKGTLQGNTYNISGVTGACSVSATFEKKTSDDPTGGGAMNPLLLLVGMSLVFLRRRKAS